MYALILALLAAAHPLHTSAAELVVDGPSVLVTLRVFSDDFEAETGSGADDAAIAEWVARGFELRDDRGRPLRLRLLGRRPVADMVHLTLRAERPEGSAGLTVRHALFFGRYGDQVNIVRARQGRRTLTLLFTRGDGPAEIR